MKRNVLSGVYSYKDESYEFNYYASLTAFDKVKFINFVIGILINDECYYSTLKDLIFDYAIIKYFTDVDTSEIDVAANTIDKIEEFLNEINVVDIIKNNIESGVIDELMNSINENIQYRTGIKFNSIENTLNHLLEIIENKVDNLDTESMMKAIEVFNGISGELTTDKLVSAVVSSYAESDLFKEKYNQVQSDKSIKNTSDKTKNTRNKNKNKNKENISID